MVFAPAPELTVTVEDRNGSPELHLHAGSQGVWQAKIIAALGPRVSLVSALGGETGTVVGALLAGETFDLHLVEATARNGGYIHDRRGGQRLPWVQAPSEPLSRHEMDRLYETALRVGIDTGSAVLSGPTDHAVLPAELYRRLASDLRSNGCQVFADLSGELLDAALAGGLAFLKVSHQELLDEGRIQSDEPAHLLAAMRELREAGAEIVMVSRAAEPALAWLPDGVYEVHAPQLQQVDGRGSGDSMTGAVAACVTAGDSWAEAARTGAAAGALNVVHHGLGTGSGAGIRALARRVELRPYLPKPVPADEPRHGTTQRENGAGRDPE